MFSRNSDTCTLEGRRLGESSAALSTLMLGGFTFQAPLLSLFAAGDAVGAQEIGGATQTQTHMLQMQRTGATRTLHVIIEALNYSDFSSWCQRNDCCCNSHEPSLMSLV